MGKKKEVPFMPNMSVTSIKGPVWIDAAPFVGPLFGLARGTVMLPPLLLPFITFSILPPFICSFLQMHKPTILRTWKTTILSTFTRTESLSNSQDSQVLTGATLVIKLENKLERQEKEGSLCNLHFIS